MCRLLRQQSGWLSSSLKQCVCCNTYLKSHLIQDVTQGHFFILPHQESLACKHPVSTSISVPSLAEVMFSGPTSSHLWDAELFESVRMLSRIVPKARNIICYPCSPQNNHFWDCFLKYPLKSWFPKTSSTCNFEITPLPMNKNNYDCSISLFFLFTDSIR